MKTKNNDTNILTADCKIRETFSYTNNFERLFSSPVKQKATASTALTILTAIFFI